MQVALKERFALWVEPITMKVVWRSVSVMCGELCVTRCGMPLMLE